MTNSMPLEQVTNGISTPMLIAAAGYHIGVVYYTSWACLDCGESKENHLPLCKFSHLAKGHILSIIKNKRDKNGD